MLDNTLQKGQSKACLLSILFIIIIGFLIYANSLGGEFLWDDKVLVEENLYIRGWSNLGKFFTASSTQGANNQENIYRPLQMVSYTIDHSFWKLDERGYHLTNIILHIAVALVLYWLALLLFSNNLIAFFSAVFFVAHPAHTAAVAYISGRADSLAALFLLLSFIFYLKRFWFLVILTYLAAIFSRESALIFPLLLVLYHLCFKNKSWPKVFWILLGLTGLYIGLRMILLRELLPQGIVYIPFPQRVLGFLASLPQYLRLLAAPFNLHMSYGYLPAKHLVAKALLGIAFLVSGLIYVLKGRGRNKLVLFSLGWFILTLIPQSNLYPVNAYMAEHWLYLPSIGFFFILAAFINRLLKKKLKLVTVCFAAGLLIFYSLLTVKQSGVWSDPEALYQQVLLYQPGSAKVYNNLGNLYQARGDSHKAILYYRKAINNNPGYADAYYNIGVTYHQMGRIKDAVGFYNRALKLDNNHRPSRTNLAVIERYQKR